MIWLHRFWILILAGLAGIFFDRAYFWLGTLAMAGAVYVLSQLEAQ